MGTPTDIAFATNAWTSDFPPLPRSRWIYTALEWALPIFPRSEPETDDNSIGCGLTRLPDIDTDFENDDDDLEVGWPCRTE